MAREVSCRPARRGDGLVVCRPVPGFGSCRLRRAAYGFCRGGRRLRSGTRRPDGPVSAGRADRRTRPADPAPRLREERRRRSTGRRSRADSGIDGARGRGGERGPVPGSAPGVPGRGDHRVLTAGFPVRPVRSAGAGRSADRAFGIRGKDGLPPSVRRPVVAGARSWTVSVAEAGAVSALRRVGRGCAAGPGTVGGKVVLPPAGAFGAFERMPAPRPPTVVAAWSCPRRGSADRAHHLADRRPALHRPGIGLPLFDGASVLPSLRGGAGTEAGWSASWPSALPCRTMSRCWPSRPSRRSPACFCCYGHGGREGRSPGPARRTPYGVPAERPRPHPAGGAGTSARGARSTAGTPGAAVPLPRIRRRPAVR